MNQSDLNRLSSVVSQLSPLEMQRLLKIVTEPQKTKTNESLFKYIQGDQPLVLLDLDGTIAQFQWTGIENYDPYLIGQPIPGAREFCQSLTKIAKVSVSTTRMNYWPLSHSETSAQRLKDEIAQWLKKHDFPSEIGVCIECLPPHVVYIGDSTLRPEFNDLGLDRVRRMISQWTKETLAHETKEVKSLSDLTSQPYPIPADPDDQGESFDSILR